MLSVGVVRGIAALTNVLFFMLAQSVLSPYDYGKLSVEINTVTFCCVILKLGFDKYLVKHYASQNDALVNHYYGLVSRFIGMLCMTLAVFLVFRESIDYALNNFSLASAAVFALVFFNAEAIRAGLKTKTSILLSGILPYSLIAIFLLSGVAIDLAIFSGIGCAFLASICAAALYIRPALIIETVRLDYKELGAIFIFNLSVVGIASVPIIAAEQVVPYDVIGRIQNSFLLVMVVGVLPLILAAYFEPLYARSIGALNEQKKLDRRVAKICWFFAPFASVAVAGIYVIWPSWFKLDALLGFYFFQIMNLLASRYQIKLLMTGAARAVSAVNIMMFCAVAATCCLVVLFKGNLLWVFISVAFSGALKLLGLTFYAAR